MRRLVLRMFTVALVAGLAFGPVPARADDETLRDAAGVLRVALPLAAAAATWRHDDADGRRQLLGSLVVGLGTTYALKQAVDKPRPNGADDDAFPSGHAAMAFSGAAFLNRRYGARYGVPAYTLAVATAWSRIETDDHSAFDVVAGAAIAIVANHYLVDRRDGVTVSVVPGADSLALRLTGRF